MMHRAEILSLLNNNSTLEEVYSFFRRKYRFERGYVRLLLEENGIKWPNTTLEEERRKEYLQALSLGE